MVARVNGRGMDFADLDFKTVFKAARGDANMRRQNRMAPFPMNVEGSCSGTRNATVAVETARINIPFTCCRMEPGNVEDFTGANLT